MYQCALKSGRMDLLAELMTDGKLSARYKINDEDGLKNPVSWPIHMSSIE